MKTIREYLENGEFSDEAIEIATRSFISEMYDDIMFGDMQKIIKEISEGNEYELMQNKLERYPHYRSILCKVFLDVAWEEGEYQEKICAAFDGTSGKLPAIDASILAVTVMYAMYLIQNYFKRPNIKKNKKNKDGDDELVEITYEPTKSPLKVISEILSIKE
jgi:hypothetical protein